MPTRPTARSESANTGRGRRGVRPAELDRVRHRDALDHRPDQPRRLDLAPPPQHLVVRPDRAVLPVMQGGDDAGGTGLPDLVERDRIVRPEPAPCLLHRCLPPIQAANMACRCGERKGPLLGTIVR